MKISYSKPIYEKDSGLLATICFLVVIIDLIALMFLRNFTSKDTGMIVASNLICLPILLVIFVCLAVNFFKKTSTKEEANKIDNLITKYGDLANSQDFANSGFYIDDAPINQYNYKRLNTMPKNLASCF